MLIDDVKIMIRLIEIIKQIRNCPSITSIVLFRHQFQHEVSHVSRH